MKFFTKAVFCFLALSFLIQTSFAQQNVVLDSRIQYNESLNDIWGYVAPDGKEYALVGTSRSISIVDVSDPANAVEVERISVGNNGAIWRDIKTWGEFAYAVDDQAGQSLIIMDLSKIADGEVEFQQWTGDDDGFAFRTAHNIFIDENGIAYLFGADYLEGGAVMLDVTKDPWNPEVVGVYDAGYVHDGFVRDNLMWTCEIYTGELKAVDISDKANPTILGSVVTPSAFTHNCWASDDGTVVYTTDEVDDAYVAAYDVTDLSDIKLLDRVQSKPGNKTVPHNTFVLGDFLVTAYYKDGLVVHDASDPSNLIEVANYDTNPLTGGSTDGAWGVYPYLPSGTVLTTDIAEGLYVMQVDYVKACYIHATTIHKFAQIGIDGVRMQVIDDLQINRSNFDGLVKGGIGLSGTYDIEFSKPGFQPLIVSDVELQNGVVTEMTVEMTPLPQFNLEGVVVDDSGEPVPNAQVVIQSRDFVFNSTTDDAGTYKLNAIYPDVYDIYVGAWGYQTAVLSSELIQLNQDGPMYTIAKGIYKDGFALDFGWEIDNGFDNEFGEWDRVEPFEYTVGPFTLQPGADSPDDEDTFCYITGNDETIDGVSGDTKILTSPAFDITDFEAPVLSYSIWFTNVSQFGEVNDYLEVKISNGTDEVILETITTENFEGFSTWEARTFELDGLIDFTATMKVTFTASASAGSYKILDVGVDAFQVHDSSQPIVGFFEENANTLDVQTFPNPFVNTVNMAVELPENDKEYAVRIYDVMGKQVSYQNINGSQLTVDGSTWNTGIYFYQVEEDGILVNSGKLIKQ